MKRIIHLPAGVQYAPAVTDGMTAESARLVVDKEAAEELMHALVVDKESAEKLMHAAADAWSELGGGELVHAGLKRTALFKAANDNVEVERLKELVRARADAAGYELASVEIAGGPRNPRFVLCWPTGDEEKLAELVTQAFGDLLELVKQNTEERGASRDEWVNADVMRMADSLNKQVRSITDEEDPTGTRRAKLSRASAHLTLAFSELQELEGPG